MIDIERMIDDWHRRYSLNLTVSLEDLKEQVTTLFETKLATQQKINNAVLADKCDEMDKLAKGIETKCNEARIEELENMPNQLNRTHHAITRIKHLKSKQAKEKE